MKRGFIRIVFVSMAAVGQVFCPAQVRGQGGGGDQFLDGIGETALVARYVFNGNERDASRNTLHATLRGSGASYVDDARFGKVLSLPGGKGAYVQIPGQALEGVDAISVSGWIQVRSSEPAQRFFDFGQSANSNFFCVPVGVSASEGFRAGITRTGLAGALGPQAVRRFESLSGQAAFPSWAHRRRSE